MTTKQSMRRRRAESQFRAITKGTVELTCLKCNKDFETKWSFGKDVTCPHCKTTWET